MERLIKNGTVIPASKLAESKELELQRVRNFEAAAADEERHRAAGKRAVLTDLKTPLTRERLEE